MVEAFKKEGAGLQAWLSFTRSYLSRLQFFTFTASKPERTMLSPEIGYCVVIRVEPDLSLEHDKSLDSEPEIPRQSRPSNVWRWY